MDLEIPPDQWAAEAARFTKRSAYILHTHTINIAGRAGDTLFSH